MIYFGLIVTICIAAVLQTVLSAGMQCDRIENFNLPMTGTLKTCYMDSTVINSTDFLITSDRDESIDGFGASGNKRFEFLPTNLCDKFPNLLGLQAAGCPIKQISKEIFNGLDKLRYLNLQYNQIETIADDAFNGIPAVEMIWLDFNQIKKLNGRAFAPLSKLLSVGLKGNDCINRWFINATEIAEMPQTVTSKCGFDIKGGPCEEIKNANGDSLGILKTCYMKSTVIDSTDFSITSARDETVEGFYARDNTNLEHLPNNLGDQLPNLLGLSAFNCSIKGISKENFRGLRKLRILWLKLNQIETIADDTFDFTPAVEKINLKGNKIKKFNGRAFVALIKLSSVWLNGNDCINDKFVYARRIAEMQLALDSKCGFVDASKLKGEPCETIENSDFAGSGLIFLTCFMRSTVIDSKDFLITSDRDVTVEYFNAEDNMKNEYLPTNIGETFPNLLGLNAHNCSIKEITRENFRGLNKLRTLILANNQIETIEDDTFDFIPAVRGIFLTENKIKKMNSRTFAFQTLLAGIELQGNICINENFVATRIAEMRRVVASKCGFEPKGGSCEEIKHSDWVRFGSIITCYMPSTVIESTEFLIASPRDETVEGFDAYSNQRLKHLPSKLGETLPNLLTLQAYQCSIREIKKKDFEGLSKLRDLNLPFNQIEQINDDTFEGIPAVERINLNGNKIKKLNGRTFALLEKLTAVGLGSNDCIDEYFNGAAIIAEMPHNVTSKCGFEIKGKLEGEFFATTPCGVPKKATPTIFRGESFDRGDFPWMVALYCKQLGKKRPKYFCGGSVISDRHALTAAHCLEGLMPNKITAVFGAYELSDHFESGRFVQSPSRIIVHDHWNPQTDQFDADIAMLLMAEKILFSTFVQPICLWGSNTAPSTSIGTVPGWGQSQNTVRRHETIPTMLQLPIHTNENCFLTFPHLADVSSNRTFCAGSADGRGPCFGDSGGGFYVHIGNVFYLRGIVSAAWDVNIYGECLLKLYTIYTDVVKFNEWIETTMNTTNRV